MLRVLECDKLVHGTLVNPYSESSSYFHDEKKNLISSASELLDDNKYTKTFLTKNTLLLSS